MSPSTLIVIVLSMIHTGNRQMSNLIKLTHVGFRAQVKIASHIVSYRNKTSANS